MFYVKEDIEFLITVIVAIVVFFLNLWVVTACIWLCCWCNRRHRRRQDRHRRWVHSPVHPAPPLNSPRVPVQPPRRLINLQSVQVVSGRVAGARSWRPFYSGQQQAPAGFSGDAPVILVTPPTPPAVPPTSPMETCQSLRLSALSTRHEEPGDILRAAAAVLQEKAGHNDTQVIPGPPESYSGEEDYQSELEDYFFD